MNTKQQSKTLDVDAGEKGIVLIAAIALMAVLALVGTVAAITTSTEIKISSNYNTSVQASYAAQAGIAEARARLRGLSSDANYAGDPAASPDEAWSAYILTSDTWASTDDPDYVGTYTNYIPTNSNHENTVTETNTIQVTPDISYWVKIRHKREDDLSSAAELYTENGSGANDIIYYGYATSTSTTAEQFTSDTDPVTASPVEIITSYGSSGNGSGVIEVQARKTPAPPIFGAIYGSNVIFNESGEGNVIIVGNDNCASDDVPCVAYVTKDIDADTTLTSTESDTTLITELSLATMIDALESTATVTLTGDQANQSFGSSSNYEVVYCDATSLNPDAELDITTTPSGGYGILVVRGDVKFGGNATWHGLVIASGTIKFSGSASNNMSIYGAVFGNNIEHIKGTVGIYYDSCEIDNAMSSIPYSAFIWEDKKLN